ncbi:MAG: hypothetical protein UU72_C0015G0013 [candidate division WWE3 bacterium GW2011_GWB1_41_6]|uniref:Uncharacterized protein n=1 Tax=candidate division WWE3 bacterium GW2011_GWB1_41_6 TaxID=1619112 RepID=A0A0G0WX13_UNCKA|nr:MAG: hypothetical protein UU72_C0015G0013 [candidate division WWE3 bacterium GW2011_GWB1_41_6]
MSENKKLRVIVGDENPDWGQKIKRWFGKDFPNSLGLWVEVIKRTRCL